MALTGPELSIGLVGARISKGRQHRRRAIEIIAPNQQVDVGMGTQVRLGVVCVRKRRAFQEQHVDAVSMRRLADLDGVAFPRQRVRRRDAQSVARAGAVRQQRVHPVFAGQFEQIIRGCPHLAARERGAQPFEIFVKHQSTWAPSVQPWLAV